VKKIGCAFGGITGALIEALASANYDQGKFHAHGEVLVDTDELTPID
jgi:hypothetical protein